MKIEKYIKAYSASNWCDQCLQDTRLPWHILEKYIASCLMRFWPKFTKFICAHIHGWSMTKARNASYLQMPEGSAFLIIQGCSMIFWRDSLFEESLTRSWKKVDLFQEGNGRILIPKTTARGLYLPPPITKNITIEKLTLVMRCLASAETWGSAGKLRSTFIILHPISTCYPIMFRFLSGNHIDWGRQKTYWYLLNVSFWLSASKGGIPKRNS